MKDIKICSNDECKKALRVNNSSGYCSNCYNKNVDGIKSKMDRIRSSGSAERPVCKAIGCEKTLTLKNSTGYCSQCWKDDADGVRSDYFKLKYNDTTERHYCKASDCDKQIQKNSATGYCVSCFEKNIDGVRDKYYQKRYLLVRKKKTKHPDRLDRKCAAESCENTLHAVNEHGYCRSCYNKNVDFIKTKVKRKRTTGSYGPEIEICKAEGCDKALHATNKYGYCSSCREKLRRLGTVKNGESCLSEDCNNIIRKQNKYGYCFPCFRANKDGIRTKVTNTLERRISRWRGLGIVLTEDEAVVHDQSTNCDICGIEFTESKSKNDKKCLDHDHETGHYRGTICSGCNKGIGLLGDNLPKILEGLFQYYSSYAHRQGKQIEVNLNR